MSSQVMADRLSLASMKSSTGCGETSRSGRRRSARAAPPRGAWPCASRRAGRRTARRRGPATRVAASVAKAALTQAATLAVSRWRRKVGVCSVRYAESRERTTSVGWRSIVSVHTSAPSSPATRVQAGRIQKARGSLTSTCGCVELVGQPRAQLGLDLGRDRRVGDRGGVRAGVDGAHRHRVEHPLVELGHPQRLVVAARVLLVRRHLRLRHVQAEPLEGAGHARGAGPAGTGDEDEAGTHPVEASRWPARPRCRGARRAGRTPPARGSRSTPASAGRRRTGRPARPSRRAGSPAAPPRVRAPTASSRSASASAVTSAGDRPPRAGRASSSESSDGHGSAVVQSPHGSSTGSARKPQTNHRCSMCSTWLSSSSGVHPDGTSDVRWSSYDRASTPRTISARTQSR